DKTIKALTGYKNKTYGGAMKAMMYSQAGKLSDEQIDQLAEYISTL
ncbi:MAG: c-type cytochrome, partial [Campylobacteraceae bacterium]|nr:c-type cytochrome [Campylobacteraceae bacterium]